MKTPKVKNLNFRITEEEYDRLTQLSVSKKIGRSQLIRAHLLKLK